MTLDGRVRVQVQLRSDEDVLAAELSNPAAGIVADAYQWEWAGRLLRSANIAYAVRLSNDSPGFSIHVQAHFMTGHARTNNVACCTGGR